MYLASVSKVPATLVFPTLSELYTINASSHKTRDTPNLYNKQPTINGEKFTGLNFCGFHPMEFSRKNFCGGSLTFKTF